MSSLVIAVSCELYLSALTKMGLNGYEWHLRQDLRLQDNESIYSLTSEIIRSTDHWQGWQ